MHSQSGWEALEYQFYKIKPLQELSTSRLVTAPLAAIMVLQGSTLPDKEEVNNIRAEMKRVKAGQEKDSAKALEDVLPDKTKRVFKQAQEKGSSTWLSALPLTDQGFTLNKGEFRDAIAIRYNHDLKGLPPKCPCGQKFDLDHALNCRRGGFVIMRHNNVSRRIFYVRCAMTWKQSPHYSLWKANKSEAYKRKVPDQTYAQEDSGDLRRTPSSMCC